MIRERATNCEQGFEETHRRRHQKFKIGVLVAPQKRPFLKFLEDISTFCGATDTAVLDFW